MKTTDKKLSAIKVFLPEFLLQLLKTSDYHLSHDLLYKVPKNVILCETRVRGIQTLINDALAIFFHIIIGMVAPL